jgi:DNA polymerase-4
VTAEKMYQKGIFTGKDLKSKTLEYLGENFGKSGQYYYHVVRGIHNSEVKPNRIRKSLAAERTFSENLSSEIFMLEKLEHIAEEVSKRLNKSKVSGKTITLKIKYSDFTLQTRSKTLPYYVSEKAIILETAKNLLYQNKMNNSVRLLGISLSNLNTDKSSYAKATKDKGKSVSVQLKFEF